MTILCVAITTIHTVVIDNYIAKITLNYYYILQLSSISGKIENLSIKLTF